MLGFHSDQTSLSHDALPYFSSDDKDGGVRQQSIAIFDLITNYLSQWN